MTNPMTYAEMLSELEYGVDLVRDNEPALFTADQIHGIKLIEKVIDSLRARVEAESQLLETLKQLRQANNMGGMTKAIDATLEDLIKGLKDKDHA